MDRGPQAGVIDCTLYSAGNFAGSKAACANLSFSDCTVFNDSYSLNVSIPLSSGVSI